MMSQGMNCEYCQHTLMSHVASLQCNGFAGGRCYNASVVLRGNPRVLGSKRRHDPPETEVDAGGHEGRPDGQAHDLDEEAVLVPLVAPADDATGVAQDLADEAQDQRHVEGMAAAGEQPDEGEGQQGHRVEGQEDGVGRQPDAVCVQRGVDGAGRVVRVVEAELPALAVGHPGCVLEVGVHDGFLVWLATGGGFEIQIK